MNPIEWFFSIFLDLYVQLLSVLQGFWLVIIALLVIMVILDQIKSLRSARNRRSARLNMPGE